MTHRRAGTSGRSMVADILATLGTLILLGLMVYPLVRDLLDHAPLP